MDESCNTGWCGKNFRKRVFKIHDPVVCYESPAAAAVNRARYDDLRYNCLLGDRIQVANVCMAMTNSLSAEYKCKFRIITGQYTGTTGNPGQQYNRKYWLYCVQIYLYIFEVPKKSAKTWELKKDDLCRITVNEGPQVGDMNFWNAHDKKERFYSGKTRQLHASHLTVYDRLWSNLPYLRPMATIVGDSLNSYGVDKDGGSVHDVIGTRCDDYTYKLITGKDRSDSCHTYLTNAIEKLGMKEDDVHDVWNIFMCTGFTKEQKYFCKPSPARKGDYIEFIADMDLLVAMSTCPQGDVSTPVGQEVPDDKCFPLQVEVYRSKKIN